MSNKKLKELTNAIKSWNESRLDLFAISLPKKQDAEFFGVIRFYHHDSANDGRYATKCVRVSGTASTVEVIETLSEKFRSDMRMLTKPNYALYEVHVNGESRKMKTSEKPLLVQLSWIKDDREGRFLLKNEDDKRPVQVGNGLYEESEDTVKGFKLTRNLTKKEKKQKKKREKQNQKHQEEAEHEPQSTELSTAQELYNQVPESTFTRTVSNPEAVMKKRREQKLQKRGAETLKVYGDSINKEIPYKTLLLLPNDKTDTVVRDALDKYGLGKEKATDYMIVQVVLPPGSKPEECFEGGWGKETVLDSDDYPLDIEQKWQPHQGTLVFQLRHRSKTNHAIRKKTKEVKSEETSHEKQNNQDQSRRKPTESTSPSKVSKRPESGHKSRNSRHPKFLEFLGSGDKYENHTIVPNVTEIGSDHRNAAYGTFIELRPSSGLMPCHCVVTNMEGVVTITPHDRSGEVFMDRQLIEETTMLSHGDVIWLGRSKPVVFCDPGRDISIPDIKKKIRGSIPPSSQRGVRSRINSAQNLPAGNRPKDESVRNRQYSSTSSVSTNKSASLPPNSLLPDRNQIRAMENHQQQRPSQSRSQLTSTSSSSGIPESQHRTSVPAHPHQFVQHKLPASVNLRRDAAETLLTEVLSVKASSLHFKLSPAYTIYMMFRSYLSDNQHEIVPTLTLVTDLLEQTIQMNNSSVSELSFWMANTSELLNFFRQDRDLCMFTMETQDTFAKAVQLAFRHLVQCMQRTLFALMPAFLSESDEDLPGGSAVDLKRQNQNTDDPTMYDVLHMLSSAMSLLRKCRVNAALTIQLFSQLFHSVNMWLFNKLVASPDSPVLCCREWGIRIRARLGMVETWAEKQGLELAADCHLARITQATHFLQAPKQSEDDIVTISGTCFKLNSLQLKALLSYYRPHVPSGERRISTDLINKVVAVAENSADELTRSDGRDIRLEEDPDLQLPFLLPEDGYSCDVVHGVPSGLTEFVEPFVQEGFCTYYIEPDPSPDSWTVFFHSTPSNPQVSAPSQPTTPPDNQSIKKPEIVTITMNKRGGGMGLSIVAERGLGQDKLGVYIRSVVENGASDVDGRLQAGDQLLSVDGHSLVGLDQSKAADLMMKTGPTVTLTVAKQGAIYHGLATMLSQPSPKQQHTNIAQRRVNAQYSQPRPKSAGYALPPQSKDPPWSASPTSKFPPNSPQYGQRSRPVVNKQREQPSIFQRSTTQLNETYEPTSRVSANAPRPAMSMGNLQQTSNESEVTSPRDWKKDRFENLTKPQYKNRYNQYTRQKAASSTNLPKLSAAEQLYNGRKVWQQDKTNHRPLSGRKETTSPDSLPPPPAQVTSPRSEVPHVTEPRYQSSLDNPNYDYFPPPPSESELNGSREILHEKSVLPETLTSPSSDISSPTPHQTSVVSDSQESTSSPPSSASKRKKSPVPSVAEKSSKSQTLGRPGSGKRTETSRVNRMQKKNQVSSAASKSSTLPRHFKSASPWERDERDKQEQAIQEQLNALRDEEISELSAKEDQLTPHEQDRLKNLLQERDFQARVQEERMRMFSDEDISEEDYSVPDRPDRDRLIRLEDAQQAQRDAAALKEREKEDRDRALWEEEQRRKKEEADLRSQQEAERREERRRERERREREREEEKRKKEEERAKEEEERILREKRSEFLRNNEIEEGLHREEVEQRRRLEEIRKMREEEENQLREIQAKREAEERSLRLHSDHRRRQEKLLQQRESEAREEAEREFLEQKLSAGKTGSYPAPYKKQYTPVSYAPKSPGFSANRNLPKPAPKPSQNFNSSRPVMRDSSSRSHAARPVSDGYMLGRYDWDSEHEHVTPPLTPPMSAGGRRPISYVATTNTPGVIGSQEVYKDPRNRMEADIKREQSFKRRGPDPSRMTFKDRQRLFQGGSSSPVTKPKSSRKLLEIQESLRNEI